MNKKMIMDNLKNRLPFGLRDRKRMDHFDEMKRRHSGKGVMKRPQDVLRELDLRRFGIKKAVNDETTDKEKMADLELLEEAEGARHPFMTLLTNPGAMSEIECLSV